MKLPVFLPLALFGLLCVTTATGLLPAAEPVGSWPQFLGPRRNGISNETGLLKSWPAAGPKVAWRVPGGVGMSGLVVGEGRLVTLVQRAGKQRVVALDPATGKEIWETPVAPEYENAMGNGPRGTPVIYDGAVYAFTGEGNLVALAAKDGKLRWQQDAVGALKGTTAEYGMACSPLLTSKHVIVTGGAPGGTVVAYDRQTGKLAWKVGNDPAGYSSPALLNVGGRPQVVAFTGASALGIDPDTGKQLWRYEYATNYECNIATPIAWEGKVFLSAGENHGSVLLELTPAGEGFQTREVWSSFGPQSVMRNEWQTSILLDGHLYGLDNVGGAGPITHFNCVEIATGKRVWQQPRFGKGNLIYADGKLWLSTMKGELVALIPSPKGFEEMGRAVVLGTTRQAPALAAGHLYLRDDQEIVCVDIRQQ